jgi:hypothetical protein
MSTYSLFRRPAMGSLLVGVATATVVALAVPGTAAAASEGSGASTPLSTRGVVAKTMTGDLVTDPATKDSALIPKYDRYAHFSPARGWVLDIPARVRQADPAGSATAIRLAAATNAKIAAPTLTARGPRSTANVVRPSLLRRSGCGDHGCWSFSWTGRVHVWMDEWLTAQMEGLWQDGAGAEGLVALLVGATGLTAGVAGLFIGAFILADLNLRFCDNGNGVDVYVYPPYLGFYCSPL